MTYWPNIIIGVLWIVSALVDYVDFLYLWQLKEYRTDRMLDFFSTKQGQQFWRSYPLATRAFLIIGIYVFLKEILSIEYVVIIILGLDFLYNLRAFNKGTIRRPVITKKILLILLVGFLIEGILLFSTKLLPILLLLLTFRFLLVSIIVWIFGYPTKFIKQFYYIYRARKKIEKNRNIIIIGITGSYGKSTVKTFLNHILSAKFKTISTPKNINTEIGIADFILSNNFQDKEIFIVEMGAYKEGEIQLLSSMVKPQIGILTAINEQHLSLFGSIQKTQKTKYELLRSLPEDGLAITNSDNRYSREYLHELKCLVKTFGLEEEYKPNLLITDTKSKGEELSFTAILEGINLEANAPIAGEHNASNIAACVLAAIHLGMNIEEIKEKIKTLKPAEQTMKLHTYGQTTVIDDSYNSNPDGFKAALSYLASFSSNRKRIVITRGMLELGDKSDEIHKRIGEEIAFAADELVIITKDFEKPLRSGIHAKYRTTVFLKDNPDDLLTYIQNQKNTNSVILLENRLPTKIYREIIGSQYKT